MGRACCKWSHRFPINVCYTYFSRIMAVQSADEFYTTMGVLTQEMLDCRIVDGDELIKVSSKGHQQTRILSIPIILDNSQIFSL